MCLLVIDRVEKVDKVEKVEKLEKVEKVEKVENTSLNLLTDRGRTDLLTDMNTYRAAITDNKYYTNIMWIISTLLCHGSH